MSNVVRSINMTAKMHRGIKYRLYPTPEQQVLINETFGHSRFVYNKMLRLSKDAYDKGEKACFKK